MRSIGNAFKYQYDAGAAIDTVLSAPAISVILDFKEVRNLR
jgi:hypothetical protein